MGSSELQPYPHLNFQFVTQDLNYKAVVKRQALFFNKGCTADYDCHCSDGIAKSLQQKCEGCT